MSCGEDCRRLKAYSRMAHCGSCHRTFSGTTPFDKHRSGGVCHDPQTRNMAERDGVWSRIGDGKSWWA